MASPNLATRSLRRLYHSLGFKKGYNFALWTIFGGAMIGFALSRLPFLDFENVFCNAHSRIGSAIPGECYFYRKDQGAKAGILLHLGTILPAGLLVVLQFVPAIRHRAILVHRICGYLIILLSAVGMAGVFLILKFAYGGMPDMQTVPAFATISFVVSKCIAIYNIKRLQIEQHRAWMIRAWAIAGYIITMRILSFIMASIVSGSSSKPHSAIPCAVVDFMYENYQPLVVKLYPSCIGFYNGTNPDQYVLVQGDVASGRVERLVAAYNSVFSSSSWLALAIHFIGAEIYLSLTSAESERLRKISYQRQLEAGLENPGDAGLTAQRLGDAVPWVKSEE